MFAVDALETIYICSSSSLRDISRLHKFIFLVFLFWELKKQIGRGVMTALLSRDSTPPAYRPRQNFMNWICWISSETVWKISIRIELLSRSICRSEMEKSGELGFDESILICTCNCSFFALWSLSFLTWLAHARVWEIELKTTEA